MPASGKRKLPDITLIGAGTLARALANAFHQRGYPIREIVSRERQQSRRRAGELARRVAARAVTWKNAELDAAIVWICVPDDAIAKVAEHMAQSTDWTGKIVVHSSGALASSVLDPVKVRGARIASAHPLMTFVSASETNLDGVPFALEGEVKALSLTAAIVRNIGGKPLRISARYKPAYHAFGFFSSPALASLIAAAQEVGKLAGFSEQKARELMEPIVRQTIENCFRSSPRDAFSGPLRRGDVATIRKHLAVLKTKPELLQVYRALSEIALKKLPGSNRHALKKLLADKP